MRLAAVAIAVLLSGCHDFAELLARHRPPFVADVSDMGLSDAGADPDLAQTSGPHDLLPALDLPSDGAVDLGIADLATPVDLAAPADVAVRVDLTAPDLAPGPDLLPALDLLPPGNVAHFATGASPADVRIGDVNGDKIADVVVSLPSATAVVTMLGQGRGAFALSAQSVLTGAPAKLAPLADFDGDGLLDVASINETDKAVYVAYGQGDGTFAAAQTYALASPPTSIDGADFNGDNLSDLVVASSAGGTLTVLLAGAMRTFAASAPIAAGQAPTHLAIADLDGNSTQDLVVSDLGKGNGNLGYMLLSGKGDGTFQKPQKIKAAAFAGMILADLDGDGLPEVVYTDSNLVAVGACHNRGKLYFEPAVDSALTATSPGALVAADLNRDGRLDVAVADVAGAGVVVLAGSGVMVLTPAASYAVGLAPVAVRAGDLDGSGGLDLVSADSGDVGVSLVFQPL